MRKNPSYTALLRPTRLLISEKSATYKIKWSYTIIWQLRVSFNENQDFLFFFFILPQSFRFIQESLRRRAKLCQFIWMSPKQKTQPTNSRLSLNLKLEHVRWLKSYVREWESQISPLFLDSDPKILGSNETLWEEEQNFANLYERLQDKKLSKPTRGSVWSWN